METTGFSTGFHWFDSPRHGVVAVYKCYHVSTTANEGPSQLKRLGSGSKKQGTDWLKDFMLKGESDSPQKPRNRNSSRFVWKVEQK